jgi:acetoin:2,6-dichlorophenolindophenol oxidoreductase subunit alpha
LALYKLMRRIRAFEDAAEIASQGGVAAWGLSASAKPALVRGPLHLSTGQEAVARLHPPRARPHAGQGRRHDGHDE